MHRATNCFRTLADSSSITTAPPTVDINVSAGINLGIILGVVGSATVVLIAIIIVIIILLCIVVQKRSRRSMNFQKEYEEVSKLDSLPLSEPFPFLSVSDIEPYATVNATCAKRVPTLDIELNGNAAYGLRPANTGFIRARQNEVRQVPDSDIDLSGNAAYGLTPATGFRHNDVYELQNIKTTCNKDPLSMTLQHQEYTQLQGGHIEDTPSRNTRMNAHELTHQANETAVNGTIVYNQQKHNPVLT